MMTNEEFIQKAGLELLIFRRVPEGDWLKPENHDQYPAEWKKDWWITEDGHWCLYWPFKDVSIYPKSPAAKEYFQKHFTEEIAFGRDHAYHSRLAILHILERFKHRTNCPA